MKEGTFSDKYFDSGAKVIGQYRSYEKDRFNLAFSSMCQAIKERINPRNILDIGCAKGYLVQEFNNNSMEGYGVDISEYAILSSPQEIRSSLKVCDLNNESLPYSDNFFDSIVCMGTLEYIQNQENALFEINRVLKNNGFFLMTTLSRVSQDDKLRVYAKSKNYWINRFEDLQYSYEPDLAEKIFSIYVKKINEFDFKDSLMNPRKKTFKEHIGRLLFSLGAKSIVLNHLYHKQIKAGYTMLAFRKSDL